MNREAFHGGNGRPCIVNVVNYSLPAFDYRVRYALARSSRLRIMFALPARPAGIPDQDFVQLDVGEGLRVRDVRAAVRLLAMLLRLRHSVDLAHFYSTKLILAGPLLARATGVAAIITLTGFGRVFNGRSPLLALPRALYWLLFHRSALVARALLFQNHGDLQLVTTRYPHLASRCHYVGSATQEREAPPKDFSAPVLRVLHVARLLPSKGIDDFLEVAHAVRDEPVEMVLVGAASPGHAPLLRRVEAAAASGIITYSGRLEFGELLREYDRSHVLLFPSHGEGMARVMLEAGMARLCPVAYDISANRDLVNEGRGRLVRMGDRAALAEALRSLVRDRALLERNAAAFQQHVRAEFATASYVARFDRVVAALLEVEVEASP